MLLYLTEDQKSDEALKAVDDTIQLWTAMERKAAKRQSMWKQNEIALIEEQMQVHSVEKKQLQEQLAACQREHVLCQREHVLCQGLLGAEQQASEQLREVIVTLLHTHTHTHTHVYTHTHTHTRTQEIEDLEEQLGHLRQDVRFFLFEN